MYFSILRGCPLDRESDSLYIISFISYYCSIAIHDELVMEHNEEPESNVVSQESMCASSWNGFKIVGDNLDKHVTPHFIRISRQSQSLHYFNSFTVKNRVDLTSFSSFKPIININVNTADILPSSEVHSQVLGNITILVARILVDNMAVFKLYFDDGVVRHIHHKYTNEMSNKSEVVRLILIKFRSSHTVGILGNSFTL